MPNFALLLRPEDSAATRGGFLTWMRAWFTPSASGSGQYTRSPVESAHAAVRKSLPVPGADAASIAPLGAKAEGVVVAFPLNAYVQLRRLSKELDDLFVELGLDDHHPVELRVTGGATPRLWIDSESYVEFRGTQSGFAVILDGAFQMRMTFEALQLDEASRLVRAYIVARLVDAVNAVGVRA